MQPLHPITLALCCAFALAACKETPPPNDRTALTRATAPEIRMTTPIDSTTAPGTRASDATPTPDAPTATPGSDSTPVGTTSPANDPPTATTARPRPRPRSTALRPIRWHRSAKRMKGWRCQWPARPTIIRRRRLTPRRRNRRSLPSRRPNANSTRIDEGERHEAHCRCRSDGGCRLGPPALDRLPAGTHDACRRIPPNPGKTRAALAPTRRGSKRRRFRANRAHGLTDDRRASASERQRALLGIVAIPATRHPRHRLGRIDPSVQDCHRLVLGIVVSLAIAVYAELGFRRLEVA